MERRRWPATGLTVSGPKSKREREGREEERGRKEGKKKGKKEEEEETKEEEEEGEERKIVTKAGERWLTMGGAGR